MGIEWWSESKGEPYFNDAGVCAGNILPGCEADGSNAGSCTMVSGGCTNGCNGCWSGSVGRYSTWVSKPVSDGVAPSAAHKAALLAKMKESPQFMRFFSDACAPQCAWY